MLQHDDVGAAGGQDFVPAGIGRVHQATLPLQDDHVGLLFHPGLVGSIFQLPGNEVVDQGIQHDAVLRALHPGGLPGSNHCSLISGFPKGMDDNPGGRPLSYCAVCTQHRNLEGLYLFDIAGKRV